MTKRQQTGQVIAVDETQWGPAMSALSPMRRAFVLALYQVPLRKSSNGPRPCQVEAAKLAGYQCSTPEAWAALASQIIHDEKVQRALAEHDKTVLRAAAPRALMALHNMVEDTEHRDHARAVGMVLDRTMPAQTTHRVEVDHQHRHEIVATEKVLARIEELTRLAGLDSAALPPMIEGTYEEDTPSPLPRRAIEADHEHDDD